MKMYGTRCDFVIEETQSTKKSVGDNKEMTLKHGDKKLYLHLREV